MNHCVRHYEEPMAGHCRTCQRSFCSRCLVFAFGPTKPPYCVGCALAAAGVRNGVKTPVRPAQPAQPTVDRKAARAQRKAEKAAAKAQAKAAKQAVRHAAPQDLPAGAFDPRSPRPSHVPGPSQLTVASGDTTLRSGI